MSDRYDLERQVQDSMANFYRIVAREPDQTTRQMLVAGSDRVEAAIREHLARQLEEIEAAHLRRTGQLH